MNRLCVRLLVLALAALAAPLAAAVPLAAPAPPLEERDWLLPSEAAPVEERVRSRAAAAEAGPPCPRCGTPATYTSFAGVEHEVLRYSGRHVDLLVPADWLGLFTPDELLSLVDVADRTYELLHQLVGREPGGPERLPVAYVDPSCGIACGFVGHKGVEIWPGDLEDGSYDPFYLDDLRQGSAESVPHIFLFHEMAHNFDVYAAHLHYHDDSSHFWTDLVNVWGYVYGMMEGDVPVGSGVIDDKLWFERERAWVEATALPYLNRPGGSWQACVRDNACDGLLPRTARVGLPLALFEKAGPLAAKRTMEFLRQWQQANPQPPPTPEAREELWAEALAAGAGADIGACLDAFSWHNPPSLAPRLAAHGPPAAFCQDGDADGASALLGDCAPGDPAVAPGRPEVPNGVDDDCNGVVDEALPAAPNPSGNFFSPKKIPAPPVAFDVDVAEGLGYLGFRASPGRLRTRACSPSGGFQGVVWLFGPPQSDDGAAFVERGGCSTEYLTIDEAADWRLALEVTTDFGDLPGPVRIALGPAAPWPGPWGSVGLLPLPGGGFELSATILDPSAFRQPADRVLFQVSGFGEVGRPLLAGGATATTVWNAETTPGKHFVYAQPYAGEVPAGPPQRLAFDPAALAPCQAAAADVACLLGGRFEVRGTMRDFESPPNTLPVRVMEFPGGRAESEQAAFFESFNPGNFEIGVKMVDACALPDGHPNRFYWLFVGGLTTAETLVRVEDTASGAVVEWTNPRGALPTTTADTAAFECGGAPAPGACVPGDEAACLLGRFRVTGSMADFETPPTSHPLAVMDLPGGRAETEQAAFFESFQPGNFEVGVKMVDACGLPPGNPSRAYWLFAGGLTSARTDLAIRQVATGQVVEWINPAGALPTSTADTAAFPCP